MRARVPTRRRPDADRHRGRRIDYSGLDGMGGVSPPVWLETSNARFVWRSVRAAEIEVLTASGTPSGLLILGPGPSQRVDPATQGRAVQSPRAALRPARRAGRDPAGRAGDRRGNGGWGRGGAGVPRRSQRATGAGGVLKSTNRAGREAPWPSKRLPRRLHEQRAWYRRQFVDLCTAARGVAAPVPQPPFPAGPIRRAGSPCTPPAGRPDRQAHRPGAHDPAMSTNPAWRARP